MESLECVHLIEIAHFYCGKTEFRLAGTALRQPVRFNRRQFDTFFRENL